MSFGFSPSDILTLISLTQRAYYGWRSAGRKFQDISDTLYSFEFLISSIHRRFDDLTVTKGLQSRQEELEYVLRGCRSAISELDKIARTYQKLTHLNRLRLGLEDVASPKERLLQHMGLLTPFLLITEMESIGKDIRSLPGTFKNIPNMIQAAVTVALGNMIDTKADDRHSTQSSRLTTYGDDDKSVYKELRRSLRALGIRDADVREHKAKLFSFMSSILKPDEPSRKAKIIRQWSHGTSTVFESTKVTGVCPEDISYHRSNRCPTHNEEDLKSDGGISNAGTTTGFQNERTCSKGDDNLSENESTRYNKDHEPSKSKTSEVLIIEKPYMVDLEDTFAGGKLEVPITYKAHNKDTNTLSSREKILKLSIKPGLMTGSTLKFKQMGGHVNGVNRDLHLIVCDSPHPLFHRDMNNLRSTIAITPAEAQNGWACIVKTIDEKEILLQHPGPTSSEWTERIPGLGMPKPGNPSNRGDLIIDLIVVKNYQNFPGAYQFAPRWYYDVPE